MPLVQRPRFWGTRAVRPIVSQIVRMSSIGMTGAVSDETDDEGRGAPEMKQSHEFRTREASNPNDWLRRRLVASEFHCGVPR
jgi:hypothetical protein